MTCTPTHLASQIQEHGFRLTRQRLAILNILYDSGGHLTPTEVFQRLHVLLPGVTEPTVYRNLDFLRQHGFIHATSTPSGRLEYQIVTHSHHHLTCKICGATIEFEDEHLQPLFARLEEMTGYHLSEHHVTFMGFCPQCKSKGE
ncbi:MAG: hypothetical protein DDG60_10620 [Anaerolineae bacterium]|nr:MAG: hypothetical protein DDG60_10620 [Anaerolineae bacterium]